MSVISVQELWPGRDSDSTFGESRAHKRVFRVLTDSHADDGTVAGSAAGLPTPYSAHPNDPASLAKSMSVSQDAISPRRWTVTVEYSTTTQEREEEDNPLDEPVKRSWSCVKTTRIVDKDTDGNAVLNPAGDPYDPPIEIPRSLIKVKFVRNEPSFSGALIRAFVDKINSGPWGGAATGNVRCDDISAEEAFKKGVSYFVVSYEFTEDPQGWNPAPLAQGFRELQALGGDGEFPVKILGEDGKEIDKPVPLDADGHAIPPDELPAAAVFETVEAYEVADFNDLELPA